MHLTEDVFVGIASGRGLGLFARRSFARGEAVHPYKGDIRTAALVSPNSLQVGPDTFLESEGGPDHFVNHSCNPSCRLVFPGIVLTALRPLKVGDELTFDYCTTEWDLIEGGCAFVCLCGAPSCRSVVRGFKHLPSNMREGVIPHAAPHILELARLSVR